MENKKNTIFIIILIVIIWGMFTFLNKDTYVGFFYPDANNLLNDIQSPDAFDSLEACRDWVGEQALIQNLGQTVYDYECGKNCDLSGGKPYVCEETLR